MPIDSIDSRFPLEALSPVSDIARTGTVGSGGNRRKPSQSGSQDQPEDGGHDENASDYTADDTEAAILTLSAASLEQEDVSLSEIVVSYADEEEPIPLINEMA